MAIGRYIEVPDGQPIEQSGEQDRYKQYLLDKYIELASVSDALIESYLTNEENTLAHNMMISRVRRLWIELEPKVRNGDLSSSFRLWVPMIYNPRLFLEDKYCGLIFPLETTLRNALEHLGITKL